MGLRSSLYMHGFSPLSGWAVKTSLHLGFYILGLMSDMPLGRLTNHYTTLTLDKRSNMFLPWRMLSLIVTCKYIKLKLFLENCYFVIIFMSV